jgi:hypothetical protein
MKDRVRTSEDVDDRRREKDLMYSLQAVRVSATGVLPA